MKADVSKLHGFIYMPYLDRHTPSTVTITHYIPRDVKSNELTIYQSLMGFIVWFILALFFIQRETPFL